MSSEDKTLRETIAEGLGGNDETTKTQANETDKGISAGETSGETKAGETPEYVSGIDISDIPEEDRPRIKELLGKKAKLLEDGYQTKFKEVADYKKEKDNLSKAGITVQEASDALKKYISNKSSPELTKTDQKQTIKTLDKLIAEAPYEQQAALKQMRDIINEETEVSVIRKELDDIKKSLGFYQQKAMQERKVQVENDLVKLSEKYGQELINKYKDIIVERGLQYPDATVSKILSIEVPIEEIEQAILLKGKKPLTKEKREAISSNGSGVTSAGEKIDVKTKSFADILMGGLKK